MMQSWNELSDDEQIFVQRRYLAYLEVEYDGHYFNTHNGRARVTWAQDKAQADLVRRRKNE